MSSSISVENLDSNRKTEMRDDQSVASGKSKKTEKSSA